MKLLYIALLYVFVVCLLLSNVWNEKSDLYRIGKQIVLIRIRDATILMTKATTRYHYVRVMVGYNANVNQYY